MTEGVHACGAVGPGLLQEMLSKRQLGSPGLWVRPLSMSGGRKRGPVALLLPALGPHSQDRPCAQVKRNRAGREMTHPLLSLGSLPQQPSERNWAPKPRAGCAFSQQTRRAPPLPTAPPELRVPGPTLQEAVFPALRKDASGGRGPAPAPGLAHPSRNTQSASCPPPCTQGGPRTFLWGFLFKGPAVGGRWEKGHPRTRPQGGQDSSESLSPTVPLGPEPRLGGLHFPLGNGGSGERTPRLASPRQG